MKFISLFSGAMGLDLGLEQSGFEPGVCVEIDPAAIRTIRHNRPQLPLVDRSIEDVSGKELCDLANLNIGDVDLVAGGPPCQAFSIFGNRKGIHDSRGQLVFEFIRIVDETRPKVFVMENVRGLLSMPLIPRKHAVSAGLSDPNLTRNGSLVDLIFQKFAEIGYRIDCYVVNVVNYGAPQIRERLLFVGNRYGLVSHFPSPTRSNRVSDRLPPFATLGDVIGPGFVDPCPEVMNFSPRKLRYLAMVPPGGNWRSLPIDVQKESMGKSWYLKGGRSAYWRKLSFAFPSPTVVTMPNHAGTSMCHPTELRAISIGEAAAIQEFPPGWEFTGTVTEKFRQVGNAVPVRLGRIAGEEVQDLLTRIRVGESPAAATPQHQITHIRPHVRTRTFWKNGEAYSGDVSYYDDHEDREEAVAEQLSLAI